MNLQHLWRGHRLFAWLSVPKGRDGPLPALLRMPDYASVHDIIYTPLRHGAVVINASHRGQRNSDGAYRASYPGLLTDGIADGESWMMLAAYADALRALDALLTQDIAEIGPGCSVGRRLGSKPSAGRSLPPVADRVRGGGHPDAPGTLGGLGFWAGIPPG